jgi:YVTN family beta-propeller protein
MDPRASVFYLGLAACAGAAACGDDGGGGGESTDAAATTPPATEPNPSSDAGTEPGPTEPDPSATVPDPTQSGPSSDPTTEDPTGDPLVFAEGPSKGGPIAVNSKADTLAVANRGTDEVTLFALAEGNAPAVRARIFVGDEPSSVSWSPDGRTLFVVCRGSGQVHRVLNADGVNPTSSTVTVGSEPIQGALSPGGSMLYVTSWVDAALYVVDTSALTVVHAVDVGGNPFGVCVTNDGDTDEGDETIFVTDFYGRPRAGAKEGTDAAAEGRVFRVASGDYGVQTTVLAPIAEAGIAATPGTGVYPNQLNACAINMNHVYVTGVGASPQPFMNNTDFRQNVQGMVYAIDLATGLEDPARTVNLNALIDVLAPPKRFVAVPNDIAFAPNSDFGYFTSLASDHLQRVDYSVTPIAAGAPSGTNFLQAGKSPTGVAILAKTAFVVNEVGRSISVIDLATQTTTIADLESTPQPVDPTEAELLRGQRFFETGLARWSTNGWVSCAACHPHGTTDNVTWLFPSGPRQTTDLTATFSRDGAVQRVLNWTAIFDEVHDFELNTRGVANGTGAIVSDPALNMDGTPNAAARIDIVGPGGIGDPQNAFNKGSAAAVAAGGATPDDWDAVEAYIRSLRAPHGRSRLSGDPAKGRDVFLAGNCQYCHGGALWTLSERYYTPLLDADASGTSLAAAGVPDIRMVRPDQVPNKDTSAMTVIQVDANGPPHRHSCVVRKVGTFDSDGPAGRGADEVRQNATPAQGPDGYNVPSLLGMATGAPYLHHGAAATLEELLSPAFQAHFTAGNQVFAPTEQEKRDLIAFILAIDDDTEVIPVPEGQRICPVGFAPPKP